ncbi:MAG: alpha-hydroxy-acid oxidizing protein [Saprospiraceae bacterium]|nr:alpha-hydroxy-acid oxidizing protein [Saprospiraceae bacterium]MBK9221594.1 alpha-hydroxy-acid oxidizing protein [Saprospiraceae bacterium]
MALLQIGKSRQGEIYLNGFNGVQPSISTNGNLLEEKARKILNKKAFGYIFAGAGSNQGIQNNLEAFKSYKIRSRILQGVEWPELTTNLLDLKLPYPFLFAPIGVLGLAHPKGDLELANASKITQTPMIQSNQASFSMEACAEILGNTNRWFQLYFGKSRDLVESLVNRAEISGSKAIVLTLDTTLLGWRCIDLDQAYLPFLRGLGLAQYTSDPVFRKLMQKHISTASNSTKRKLPNIFDLIQLFNSYPDTFFNNIKSKNPIKAVSTFLDIYSNPSLSWEDVKWLKTITKLPIILKGILHPEDALKAIDYGVQGIIVSNHGGRQIDQVISSLESMKTIKKTMDPSFPLILDSGIRTGIDIFIALALGAKAVCLGRPYAYALAINGHQGVIEYVQNMASELSIAMSLVGCKTIDDISENLISI